MIGSIAKIIDPKEHGLIKRRQSLEVVSVEFAFCTGSSLESAGGSLLGFFYDRERAYLQRAEARFVLELLINGSYQGASLADFYTHEGLVLCYHNERISCREAIDTWYAYGKIFCTTFCSLQGINRRKKPTETQSLWL